MPENQSAFGAKRLVVGQAALSLDMKRLGKKKWTATLHLEKGELLEVTMDFWASHRSLSGISADGKVTWDKSVDDTQGREGRCTFTLDADKDWTFTVSEGSTLPKELSEPPSPAAFHPDPYDVSPGDLLLLTSPTAILNERSYKFVVPGNFLPVGRGELD